MGVIFVLETQKLKKGLDLLIASLFNINKTQMFYF